jgi:PIN domain nuclease of toxin-antitoxin system
MSVTPSQLPAAIDRPLDESWTRDPLDRLVAEEARPEGARLVTADTSMRKHLDLAVWS